MALPCGSFPLCGPSNVVQIQNSARGESPFLPADKQTSFSGTHCAIKPMSFAKVMFFAYETQKVSISVYCYWNCLLFYFSTNLLK